MQQHPLHWIPFLILCFGLSLWTFRSLSHEHHAGTNSWTPSFGSKTEQGHDKNGVWRFETARDADNTALTDQQCIMAFPDAYQEIDRSNEYWRAKGGIRRKDIDIEFARLGALRARISKRQVCARLLRSSACH